MSKTYGANVSFPIKATDKKNEELPKPVTKETAESDAEEALIEKRDVSKIFKSRREKTTLPVAVKELKETTEQEKR